MNKILLALKSVTIFLLIILSSFCFAIPAVFAHSPHDDIYQVEISPTYDRDRTLFVVVRGNLLKSADGGDSWHRVVRGLDNRYQLYSLGISSKDQKTLFLSSLGDGIYKSEDTGDSWVKVNNGLEDLNIDLLSISSHSSDVVLAAGREKGLYLTKNGGQSWTKVIDSKSKITNIAFASDDRDRVIIGDDRGSIYFSEDGGEVWKQIFTMKNSGGITAIEISPNFSSDSTFFVGTERGGIFKTVDRGKTFSPINSGISEKAIRDIVILPGDRKDFTLFASTWYKGVFYSDNGGNTWNKKSTKGLTQHPQAEEDRYKRPHFSELRISNTFSQDKTMFLAGFDGLFKSTDGGQVWKQLDTLSARLLTALAISPDYKNDSTVAIAAYNEEAYISNDKGVTWKAINKGLNIPRYKSKYKGYKNPFTIEKARFYEIVFSPNYASDNTIFTAIAYKFFRSTDRGKHWNKIGLKQLPGSSVRQIVIVPSPNFAADRTIYLATRDGGVIYRSTDGGVNFSVVGNLGHFLRSLVISPDFTSDKTLYVSDSQGVYKTVDGGYTWQSTIDNTALKERNWFDLAISPDYKVDKTVIAGTDAGVFQTKDGGKSWAKLTDSAYGEDAYVKAIAISPNYQNDRTFIISIKGRGLFKSINGGKTFTQIGDNSNDSSYSLLQMDNVPSTSVPIKFSPSYATDKTIYGFGSAKAELFRSTDAGNTWEVLAIPRHEDMLEKSIEFLSIANLVLNVYPILKFLAALICAVITYLILGYLGLEKKLPLSKLQIKTVGSLVVLVAISVILYS
ncbi:MAG: YCF48-related protein [Prochloraceae cyanobacterium]|nr:YCF48-related protein [Prochloraceae cyanobacterium]